MYNSLKKALLDLVKMLINIEIKHLVIK